jgi:hypothetical protein
MYDELFSPRAFARIFEGVLSAQVTREGKTHHFRMLGFRLVSDEVMRREGYSIKLDAGSCPDNRGVYVATWVRRDGRKLRQSFFPKQWTREQVLDAIAEAYQRRVPVKWETPGQFFEGRTRTGMRIVLELDDEGRVLDAIPRTGNKNFERDARWRVANGFAKSGRYFCAECGKLKRGHELGHPSRLTGLYRRARRRVRKLAARVGSLGRR